MNWRVIGAFVLLLAALGATGTLLYHEHAKLSVTRDALNRAVSAAKRADKATALAAREKAAAGRREAALRQALDSALSAQREWADQPVPKEVQDALL